MDMYFSTFQRCWSLIHYQFTTNYAILCYNNTTPNKRCIVIRLDNIHPNPPKFTNFKVSPLDSQSGW